MPLAADRRPSEPMTRNTARIVAKYLRGAGWNEDTTLRLELAALKARIREMGRHNTTEADKDNLFKRFTSWTSEKVKGAPTLDDMRQRMAALLRDTNNV